MSDNPSNQRKMKAKAKKPANRVNINNNVIKKPIKSQQKLDAGKKVRVGKSKTKITDLNDHCLATIFNNLSLEDLVKVAASNTRFTVASRLAFVEKHAKDTITVSNEYKSKTDKELSSVHLIRHFGHLINKLKVEYADDHHRFNQQLEYAISKHCHKTLVELELENFDKFVFHRIIRPFKAVKTVRFVEGVLGEFHMNLRKWFPNAVNLDFVEPNIQDDRYAKCIEGKMPNLEHLGVFNVVRPDEGFDYRYADEDEIEALGEIPTIFTNKNLKKAIKLNPQLKSLKLRHNVDDFRCDYSDDSEGIKINVDLLDFINKKLPLLESLDVSNTQTSWYTYLDGAASEICFDNLQKFTFNFENSYTLDYYQKVKSRFNELKLSGKNLDEHCGPFIAQQKGCKKLILEGEWESDDNCEKALKAIAPLAGLEDIQMPYNGLNGKQADIISLLKDCPSLKKLVVVYRGTSMLEKMFGRERRSELGEFAMLFGMGLGLANFQFGNNENESDEDEDEDDSDAEMFEFGEDDDNNSDSENSDNDNDSSDEDGPKTPKQLNQKSFEERFRTAFEAKFLGSAWEATYTKKGLECFAEYNKRE